MPGRKQAIQSNDEFWNLDLVDAGEMTEIPQRLGERLAMEGERTLDFFRSLTADEWNAGIYSSGPVWNVSQVLAHFVSAEKAFLLLIEDILNGGQGAPQDFNIDEFNERQVQEFGSFNPQDLLEQFRGLRRRSVELVSGITPQDLQRVGRHPFLGAAPLEDIIKLLYRHNQIHQRDIRKTLIQIGGESGP